MTPSHLVLLIAVMAFLVGAAVVARFDRYEDDTPPSVVGWLVRGLVGLAAAHTCLGIYEVIVTVSHDNRFDRAESASLLGNSLMNIAIYGGILLGFAALLTVLDERAGDVRDR